MKRREALKSITLSSGVVLSSASIVGLLQSCVAEDTSWQPIYFSKKEGKIISVLCDLILPKGETTPSATSVNVPQFIDLMTADVYEAKVGEKFKKGIGLFNQTFKVDFGDEFDEASAKDQSQVLSNYFDISSEETDEVKALVKDKTSDKSSDRYFIYCFLTRLRDLTIKAYFESEKVGEEVLAYDPIPTRWEGCIPLSEVGKLWSPSL